MSIKGIILLAFQFLLTFPTTKWQMNDKTSKIEQLLIVVQRLMSPGG